MMSTLMRLSLLLLLATSHAFTTTTAPSTARRPSTSLDASLIVVSPPGGVGEVTAVKAASMGASVKWFVVSSGDESASVRLAPHVVTEFTKAGGAVEIAGSTAAALTGEGEGAISAVKTWCQTADSLVATLDGISTFDDDKVIETEWKNGVKLAAQQASRGISGTRLAVLSAADAAAVEDEEEEEAEGGGGGFLSGLLGGGDKIVIPSSLNSAIQATTKLRHGSLFGLPESSPSFSALLGGPQKNAVLCDEYQNRGVRLDSAQSPAGYSMMSASSQACRHAVGKAAAMLVLSGKKSLKDVCITSLGGTAEFDAAEWKQELDRLQEASSSSSSDKGALLFTVDFESVPNIDRLTSWIATKWAPAILRTYDLAAIRTGARPVSVSETSEKGVVEIVWQQLTDEYNAVTSGKMIITITDKTLTATRAAGDAKRGFGTISSKPLNGEGVLVQRLADAASQAMEKGLAVKPKSKQVAAVKKVAVAATPKPAAVSSRVVAPKQESGPRSAGVRRSSERARGRQRKAPPAAAPKKDDSTPSPPPKSGDGAFE